MSKPLIALRNIISRQAFQVPADEADQILAHPIWGKVNEIVRTAKPEVLHDAKVESTDTEMKVQKDEVIHAKSDVVTFEDKPAKKKDNS